MRIRAALRTATLALVASLIAVPAAPIPTAAQQPPQGTDKAAEDAKKALGQAGRDAKKGAEAAAREVSKAFRDLRDRLRTTRQERRREQVKEARDRWGALLAKPKVRDELKLHARRMERLTYIESLADELDLDKIQDRAKRARNLEIDRFDRRMDALRASGGEQ